MNRYDEVRCIPVGEMLQGSARAAPGKVAFVSGTIRMTYKELDERVRAFAPFLQHLGLVKGDRVAIYMKNSAKILRSEASR